jgi:energy-coupling factor transporter ATP-binding protein EcfA2
MPAGHVPPVAPVTRRPRPPAGGPGPADPAAGIPLAPAWGWRQPHAGRAAYVAPGAEYQATTVQACGLYPFVAGAGAPVLGTPVGRHQLHGEVVCLDPLAWLRAGLVTNPGMFLLGQPGAGKSTLVKRLATGAIARGDTVLVLGDPRPDYTRLAEALGGQVIRVGRGMDRLNPLDAGPLGAVLPRLPAGDAARLRAEVRARRLSLLMALCTLVRGQPLGNVEEVILGRAIDLLDERHTGLAQPAVPDVLAVLEEGPDGLRAAARADSPARYRERVAGLVFTLDLLLTGTLAGVFDGPTSTPIDLAAPIVSVDISRAGAAGDKLLTAAMLCSWAYGFAIADAAAVLSDQGLAPRRSYMAVLDELWRALRGAPGLVEYADSLTRLNRARGMASIMITHSLADLDALATEEDRAKARGFMERSAISVLAALPPRELAQVSRITPLTGAEADLVASWSAPDSWQPGGRHPGRGKYLIKTGGRLGIPVDMSLVDAELDLYDTDQAVRAPAATGRPGT